MLVILTPGDLSAREAQLVTAVLAAHERTLQLQYLTLSIYKLALTLGQKMGAAAAPVSSESRPLETFLVDEMTSFARASFPDLEIRIEAAGATKSALASGPGAPD